MLKRRKINSNEAILEKIHFFHSEGYIGGQVSPTLDAESVLNDVFGSMTKEKDNEAVNMVGSVLSILAAFLLVPLHWAALTFEVFLNVKFGRIYINPLFVALSIIFFSLTLVFVGGFAGTLVGMGIGMAQSYAFSQLPIFLGLSSLLMWLHFFYAIGDYSNNPRHSRSNGVPWVYVLTKNDFYLNSIYVFYMQPAIFLIASLALHKGGQEEAGITLAVLSGMYLLRNIISHQLMRYEEIKKNDARVLAEYQDALYRLDEVEIRKTLSQSMVKHQKEEEPSQEPERFDSKLS